MRRMEASDADMYRGVVQRKDKDGTVTSTEYHGPFNTRRAAQARATQMAGQARRWNSKGSSVDSWVETALVTWRKDGETTTVYPDVWVTTHETYMQLMKIEGGRVYLKNDDGEDVMVPVDEIEFF